MRIFPGLAVNLSKSGPSLTVGMRGAHVTFGRGGVRRTIGIPGAGIYYTSFKGHHTGFHSAQTERAVDATQQRRAENVATGIVFLVVIGIALLLGVLIGALFAHA